MKCFFFTNVGLFMEFDGDDWSQVDYADNPRLSIIDNGNRVVPPISVSICRSMKYHSQNELKHSFLRMWGYPGPWNDLSGTSIQSPQRNVLNFCYSVIDGIISCSPNMDTTISFAPTEPSFH